MLEIKTNNLPRAVIESTVFGSSISDPFVPIIRLDHKLGFKARDKIIVIVMKVNT